MLRSVANSCSGSTFAQYDYTMDAQNHGADSVGRRTKVVCTGPVFTGSGLGRNNRGYNDRNEVNYWQQGFTEGEDTYVFEDTRHDDSC